MTRPDEKTNHRRLDVGVIEPAGNALDGLMSRTGLCAADVVNRALVLYDEWDRHDRAGGTWKAYFDGQISQTARLVPRPMELPRGQ